MKYKVLIVDDEEMILNMLKSHLELEGYHVLTAVNAKSALDKLNLLPDIILLDINMPVMNGYELCCTIRTQISCPIIFLTAKSTEEDKVKGLQIGGDDYIVKPFSSKELLARIKAHIRREERFHNRSDMRYKNGIFINYSERTVYIYDKPVEFSNKEFEIIKLLSMNPGQVFDRETIYEKIWGIEGIGDSMVIKEHIRKIRSKLSLYTEQLFIENVWGVGYRWKK